VLCSTKSFRVICFSLCFSPFLVWLVGSRNRFIAQKRSSSFVSWYSFNAQNDHYVTREKVSITLIRATMVLTMTAVPTSETSVHFNEHCVIPREAVITSPTSLLPWLSERAYNSAVGMLFLAMVSSWLSVLWIVPIMSKVLENVLCSALEWDWRFLV
jgi:hypothetical protein